jgi:hypothetical protein
MSNNLSYLHTTQHICTSRQTMLQPKLLTVNSLHSVYQQPSDWQLMHCSP